MTIHQDARAIIDAAIEAVLPDVAVKNALSDMPGDRPVYMVAIGKAAWKMAEAACEALGGRLKAGVVVTKYGHAKAPLERVEIIEAGHPVPDEHSVRGAARAMALVDRLGAGDRVLFLVSGGGSALFEMPLDGVTLADIASATRQLLASGADITEINTIRKHLSAVKGGRFAEACAPAEVVSIVLSDVLGDSLDAIASGPAHPDGTTGQDALRIVQKYGIELTRGAMEALRRETPKALGNVRTRIIGNVTRLCTQAKETARALGYEPLILTTTLGCEARDAGSFLAAIAREVRASGHPVKAPCAVILGGETVVHLKGSGRGGRNQELALSAALGIQGMADVLVFSVGSDGTDGPTDAAGGIVTGDFVEACRAKGLSAQAHLQNNDAYAILGAADGLIFTGPTGTNVNDLTVLLCK
ncbi:glycerate kinase [Bacillota bacterium Meth-B3]